MDEINERVVDSYNCWHVPDIAYQQGLIVYYREILYELNLGNIFLVRKGEEKNKRA